MLQAGLATPACAREGHPLPGIFGTSSVWTACEGAGGAEAEATPLGGLVEIATEEEEKEEEKHWLDRNVDKERVGSMGAKWVERVLGTLRA